MIRDPIPLTISEVLERNAARFGDRAALFGPDGRATSFADFAERVHRLAAALRGRGIGPGARVAILSRNCSEYLEVVALAAYGYVAVPLNWRLARDELAHVIGDASPSALFVDARSKPALDEIDGLPADLLRVSFNAGAGACLTYADLVLHPPADEIAYARDPEATACIVYTSGTTGRPKGAELRHRGLMQNGRVTIEEVLRLNEQDVTLCPMPLFHVGGLWYHAFPSFAAGCRTIILSEFSPQGVLSAVGRHRVTNMHVVPTMLHGLVHHPDRPSTDVSSLRAIYYAGSSMPLSVLRESMSAFPSCGFIQAYGSTEAGSVCFLSEADHRRAAQPGGPIELLASCGRPCADVEVRLAASWSEGDTEIGEIEVTSDASMARYWRNPDATAAAFAGRALRTGDLGRIDAEGYVYILDRKNDMIVTGGENVYPREVEEVLLEDPCIGEVAVFDVPDEKWVQKVVAAVVLREGMCASADEIVARARQKLAGYKCPKEIRFVEQLPRNPAGKVLRKMLRVAVAAVHDKGEVCR